MEKIEKKQIKVCNLCGKEFSSEKSVEAEAILKWAKEVTFSNSLVVYCQCPHCKKEVLIAERLLPYSDLSTYKVNLEE